MYFDDLGDLHDLELQETMASAAIERALRPGAADREFVERGIRSTYQLCGWEWHDNIVWVESPDVLHTAAIVLCGRLNDLHELTELELFGRLSDETASAVDQAIGNASAGHVDRTSCLRYLEASAECEPLSSTQPSSYRQKCRAQAQQALGVRAPNDLIGLNNPTISPALETNLSDSHLATQVRRKAQGPLRTAIFQGLSQQVRPAEFALRRTLRPAATEALSIAAGSVTMTNQVNRAIDDYLLNGLDLWPPGIPRHRALVASQAAGWTWTHRDVAVVCENHHWLTTQSVDADALDDVVIASNQGPCMTWSNGFSIERSIDDALSGIGVGAVREPTRLPVSDDHWSPGA